MASPSARPIGLSRSRKPKSTPSSTAMSLEDETQQPPVAGSSQGADPTSSAAIMQQLQQQYASSAATGPTAATNQHIIAPSSDPPFAAPSSDVTQGHESDSSIAWESNPAGLPPHGSLHRSSLDQIVEELPPHQPLPQPEFPSPQAQPASGKSSNLTDLVSQTTEFVSESQRDQIDSAESEMSDMAEGNDASNVSTPSTSDPEVVSAPAGRTLAHSSGVPMRPITQSVPGVTTSPLRTYISPSQHAKKFSTPTKSSKGPFASPIKRPNASTLFPKVDSPSTNKFGGPSKSTRLATQPTRLTGPTFSRTRSAQEGSPSPGESSDFAGDMLPTRVLNPRERFDATTEAAPLSPTKASGLTLSSQASSQASPTRSAPRWESSPTQRESAGFAGEPTSLNEDDDFNEENVVNNKNEFSNEHEENEEDELDSRFNANSQDEHRSPAHNHIAGATPRRLFQPSDTRAVSANSGLPSTPTRCPAAGPGTESQTLLNTVRPQCSQTQLNSDNPPPSSPIPRGHFASLDARSAAAPESPGLWRQTMREDEDSVIPRPTSPPQESFVATQVRSLHHATSSPFKQLLPPFPSSPAKMVQPGHDVAVDHHNTRRTAPPSDAELEPTFVEAASHTSAGSLGAAQATASDPTPPRLFPSSIESYTPPELTAASAPGLPTSSPHPPADERMVDVQEEEVTPTRKQRLSQNESDERLFRAPRPRNSPNKYGRRHNRTSHIPSTRGGMPQQPPATDDGSTTDNAPSTAEDSLHVSQPGPSCGPQEHLRPSSTLSQTSSSSSDPDDPEDETFRDSDRPEPSSDPELGQVEPRSLAEPPSPVVATRRTSTGKSKAAAVPRGRATSRARSRPLRQKRKARSSSPEFSDSSSSAPEDDKDFSYRPTEIGRAKAMAEATAERTRKASTSLPEPTPDQTAKGKGKRAAATPPSPRPGKRSKAATSAETSSTAKAKSTKRSRTAAISGAARSSRSTTSSSRTRDPSVADTAAQENPPLRVLAQWKKGDYHAGTVTSRNAGGYHVDFDDGDEVWVGLEQMRLLELRPGEPVCEGTPGHIYHVAEHYKGVGHVQVVNGHSKVRRIPVKHLLVLGLEIVRRFSDRCVTRAEVDKHFPESVDVFATKVFIVTSSEEKEKDAVIKKIQQNGGTVTNNWIDIFDITDEAHTINTQGKAPFLVSLGSKRVVSSKLMSSLAAGVPVLSPRYVEDALKGLVDWKAYLISPGESALLREPAVQVVDPAWGSTSWTPAEAQAARQPLAGTSVLWVPAGARWKGHNEINTLVPFCLRAMGASITVAASLPADLTAVEQELVAVEDRDGRKLTKQQRLCGKLVNVGWLKAVLIAGARLPPSVIRN
ncbi:hypothetical protein CcaverHIS002_0112510 [Cutaneotrichosporon cavernicola]|uniref:BRCT domain-containing protein n=1 Tax=Cutaneotrichosporon cavernicola TaxID=279322 RepID=A0AA48KZD8_9TREE|nr:uncharacterized protein CcaverHIS019_0112390 [Cutaneotrichosporon cavernicola]BEI80722.1 hypothetical protein CcaverHIS002_0112510 [Cutaneotrichosporon cavernicola]BEI88521.1 hypothetical protein CcaverHIS019_0112390 [Cutaneotrichosporon cavernicola]